ncbi:hypothetical protein BCU68_04035 [Vibrio sp. 10N.286.49.B3]|uniref:carbohydrate binding domain-containing protein n=1 Tax=Vibrio sp. 10N.286.49.B3 TaxID=1880855 RepID=UPI000C8453DD|nr:carbohydrate binding domain-containing protein [Vibrio sp. 10N.286.49.B3]PMH43165.1 hypothetical protein BCU68_04035 [Vibrio sp. 10N.286.49.B3]
MKPKIVALSLLMLVAPLSHAKTEIIRNGGFVDNGHWWAVGAQLKVSNSSGCVDINKKMPNPWDVLLGQNDIVLKQGQKYQLSFKAWSDTSTKFVASVQHSSPPYTQYYRSEIQVNNSKKNNNFEFTYNRSSNSSGQVQFQLGGEKVARVCFSDISLLAL